MKEVFRNPDQAQIGIFAGILESEGIPCLTKNSDLQQCLGGGRDPIFEFWPALCVVNDDDYPEAMKLLADLQKSEPSAATDWKCAACGETVPGNFTSCWNCDTARAKLAE